MSVLEFSLDWLKPLFRLYHHSASPPPQSCTLLLPRAFSNKCLIYKKIMNLSINTFNWIYILLKIIFIIKNNYLHADPYCKVCFPMKPTCNVPLFQLTYLLNSYSSFNSSDHRPLCLKPPPTIPTQSSFQTGWVFLHKCFHDILYMILSLHHTNSLSLSIFIHSTWYSASNCVIFMLHNWLSHSWRTSTKLCIRDLTCILSSPSKFSACPYLSVCQFV